MEFEFEPLSEYEKDELLNMLRMQCDAICENIDRKLRKQEWCVVLVDRKGFTRTLYRSGLILKEMLIEVVVPPKKRSYWCTPSEAGNLEPLERTAFARDRVDVQHRVIFFTER